MKVVMYHYVQESAFNLKHFPFLHSAAFKKQLDFFRCHGGLITKREWHNFLELGDTSAVTGKFLLTFDDGLRCHYEIVRTILDDLDAIGIFFVCGAPLCKSEILDVHKLHLLMGLFTPDELILRLRSYSPGIEPWDHKNSYDPYSSQTANGQAGRLKSYFNWSTDPQRHGLLDAVFSDTFGYDFPVSRFYMTAEEIKELSSNGYVIGAHGMNHRVLANLCKEKQATEIVESLEIVKSVTRRPHVPYAIAHGLESSYNAHTLDVLRAQHTLANFVVKSDDVGPSTDLLQIPRYNANEFPHGRVAYESAA